MKVFLWILQVLMALHTGMGAMWKFSNSEQTVPSLRAMPHGAWLALSGLELLCALGLLLPVFNRRLGFLTPVAAGCVAAEMLLFVALHAASGLTDHGPAMYWVVVAALGGLLAYGRAVLHPLSRS